MKKSSKIKLFILLMLILFAVTYKVYAVTDVTSGCYTYQELSDGTINLIGYSGQDENVILPSTIDGKRIKKIDTNTFKENSTVKTITLPEGLEQIDSYVFNNCPNLTDIYMPSTLTSVSRLFYKNCPNIRYTIPDYLTQMEDGKYLKVFKVEVTGTYMYDMCKQVLDLVNEERTKVGVEPLQYNADIQDAADLRAVEISVDFNHTRPSNLGFSSINTSLLHGENIAYGPTTAYSAVSKWMSSPPHKRNILDSSYKSIAVGCFAKRGVTWVQLFSRKESTNNTTKSGEVGVTQNVNVNLNAHKINLRILWDDSDKEKENKITLEKGEEISAKAVKLINNTDMISDTPIKLTDVTWQSSNEEVFKVDENGHITAIKEGVATLTVTLGDGIESYEVTVNDNATDFSLDYTRYQINSLEERPVLHAILDTGNEADVTWSSYNPAVATVNYDGTITPHRGGFVYIEATIERFGSKRCWVYVCTLITLSNGNKAYAGDLDRSGTFTANDASIIMDLFSKPTPDGLLLGDIDGNGSVTANDASYMMDLFTNGTFHPGLYNPIQAITLNETELEVEVGQKVTLSATTTPVDSTDSPKVTWTSSNDSIATVDDNGNVNVVGKGMVTITVTSSNGKTASCVINRSDFVLGDINEDGKVTMFDCSEALLYVKRVKELSPEAIQRGDIDGNGKLTMFDCSEILLHVKRVKLL